MVKTFKRMTPEKKVAVYRQVEAGQYTGHEPLAAGSLATQLAAGARGADAEPTPGAEKDRVGADGDDSCMGEEGGGADGAKSAAPSDVVPTGEANGTVPTEASPAMASEASGCGTKPKTISAMAININSALPQAAKRSGHFGLYALT